MAYAERSTAAPPARLDIFSLLARFAQLIFLFVLLAAFALGEPCFRS